MAQLPIRRLTLYKQGIGYFERRAQLEGDCVRLTLPRDTTDDVLKSLDVVVHWGGEVRGVEYETPADKAQLLEQQPMRVGERAGLSDLLTSLRGTWVSLDIGAEEPVEGRLIGIETSLDSAPAALLLRESAVRAVPLSQIASIDVGDRAAQDLRYFLSTSRIEESRTSLTVRLTPGTHELTVRYMAPSPAWRVSYRLTGDRHGRALLTGWAVFENVLEEDLEEVRLTLVSGRPISFEYPLSESWTPPRPQVADDPRAADATKDVDYQRSVSTIAHDLRSPMTSISNGINMVIREMVGPINETQKEILTMSKASTERMLQLLNTLLDVGREKLREGDTSVGPLFYPAGPLGNLKVSKSYFMPVKVGNADQRFLTYKVEAPVSVRRGMSAMVPIVSAEVGIEQLLVFNEAKMPNHPLLVWRFSNASGVALEQGPVTIYDGQEYRGEALVRFTGAGDMLEIPFALEFGALITHAEDQLPPRYAALTFKQADQTITVEEHRLTEHRYRLVSHISRDVQVLIERRDSPGCDYVRSPAPVSHSDGHTRWAVDLPAHSGVELVLYEREVRRMSEDPERWDRRRVSELYRFGAATEDQQQQMMRYVALGEQSNAAEQRLKNLQKEHGEVIAGQQQLRTNLAALGASEREAALRDRILEELEASEERRRKLEAGIAELKNAAQQRSAAQQVQLNLLFNPPPPPPPPEEEKEGEEKKDG